MTAEFRDAAQQVYQWAKTRDFRGQDPHDLLESPLLRRVSSPTVRLLALQIGRRSPINLRPVLGVPSAENPKGLALFLQGLLRAKALITKEWREDASELALRVIDSQTDDGGWGYPFGWQSRTHYVPRGKSNIVTTAFCGIALIEATRAGVSEAATAIESAVQYVLEKVPAVRTEGTIAFGYASDDPQIVFNASLLGAELLAQASVLLGRPKLMTAALEAAKYVCQRQRSDGSWVYGELASQQWIDSFHTGFVIESLYSIGSLSHADEFIQAAERGLDYYLRTFIRVDGAIRYFPGKDYPVDAHAIGQAISMLTLRGHTSEAERAGHWAMEHLRSPKGYFYYQKHAGFTNRVAYMRWSNAWMLKGLADLIASE